MAPTTTTAFEPVSTTATELVGVKGTTKKTTSTAGTLPVTGAPYTERLLLLGVGLLALGLTIVLSSRRILDQRHRR